MNSYGNTTGQAAQQCGQGQNGVDTGAGDQLAQGLGDCLQSDQQRDHNGSFGDPTDFLIHKMFLLSLTQPGKKKTAAHKTRQRQHQFWHAPKLRYWKRIFHAAIVQASLVSELLYHHSTEYGICLMLVSHNPDKTKLC